MKQYITLLLATLGILALAGCVQEDYEPIFVTPSDSEPVEEVAADEPVDSEETEEADSSEDTNVEKTADEVNEVETDSSSEANTDLELPNEADAELDLSSETDVELDWVTYTNEEYGFSFDYPSEWKAPELKVYESNEYQEGRKFILVFRDIPGTPSDLMLVFETIDFLSTGPADGTSILFSNLDLGLEDAELVENLKKPNSVELSLVRVDNSNGFYGVRLGETAKSLNSETFSNIQYMLKTEMETYPNLRIYTSPENEDIIDRVFESLRS